MHAKLSPVREVRKLVPAFVFLVLIWISYKLIGRSIWIEEGMLLKSIVESDRWVNYLNPLAYYDQAQPLFISLFHHFILHNISLKIEALRLATLLASLIISAPILYLFLKEKTGFLFPALFFIAFSFSIGFYITEIKHYAFEVAASFLMIAIFYLYSTNRLNFAVFTVSIAVVAMIGFSTLIPAFVLVSFIAIAELKNGAQAFFKPGNLSALVLAGLLGSVTLLHMKHLTSRQINNHDAYLSQGLFGDLKTLVASGVDAHGEALTFLTAIMVVVGLLSNRKSYLFRFTLIFLMMIGVVAIGKLTGFYPVASGRHLIWLAPFSLVLSLLGMAYLLKRRDYPSRLALSAASAIIALQSIMVLHETFKENSFELTDNDGLYSALSELPATNVVVFPQAQATLQYYLLLSEELGKHNFIGFVESFSQEKDPNGSNERFSTRVDSVFDNLPAGKFVYVLSHQPPLFSQATRDVQQQRGQYLVSKLQQYGCTHTELFTGNQVQLLEMECLGVK